MQTTINMQLLVLRTGLVPSASGSAYLELSPSPTTVTSDSSIFLPASSSLKIRVAVRSTPYTPQLALNTTVKFAPFATRQRRGYLRDASERDLGVHLEAAIRAVIIGERWPKSGLDIVVTVLEGEEDRWWGDELGGTSTGNVVGGWGMMGVLSGCITAASAAIIDAGIDCVGLVSGGVAAVVKPSQLGESEKGKNAMEVDVGSDGLITVLDPCPAEHKEVAAACVVSYLQDRDEITELWLKGDGRSSSEDVVERAVLAAMASRTVLLETLKETAAAKFPDSEVSTDAADKQANGGIKVAA